MRQKLLLATNNKGKVHEYKSLLEGIPYRIVSPVEAGVNIVVEETGNTLEENAVLKATSMARESGLLSLADDSGLEVDALGGKPGPVSARFAGENASDKDRVAFLLSKLKDVPEGKRSARFRCVIAIATPSGKVKTCSGECPGRIIFTPRGENGFGYDPIFYIPELGKTMAELPLDVKNEISHRGKAARKAREMFLEFKNE